MFFSFVNVYIVIGLFGSVRKTHLNKKKSYIQPTLHLICGIYFVIGIYFEGVKSTGFSIKNIKYINACNVLSVFCDVGCPEIFSLRWVLCKFSRLLGSQAIYPLKYVSAI